MQNFIPIGAFGIGSPKTENKGMEGRNFEGIVVTESGISNPENLLYGNHYSHLSMRWSHKEHFTVTITAFQRAKAQRTRLETTSMRTLVDEAADNNRIFII